MDKISIIFFGSTSDSVTVARKLAEFSSNHREFDISAVVTQPPRPVGRKQVLTPTPVEVWAKENKIAVLSFPTNPNKPWLYENEQTVIDALQPFKADLIISACYGQKIPTQTIQSAKFGGLNIHPSLLPRWRGADPVPWAILTGDRQTGVTVLTLEEKFDAGKILGQKKIPLTDKDFSDPLRTKLFTLGADLLTELLPDYLSGKNKGKPQDYGDQPYARRLTRDDGFESWGVINEAINSGKEAERLNRKFRAFSPWPGLWTKINLQINKSTNGKWEEKRLKILDLTPSANKLIINSVQLEGKKPVAFAVFRKAYPQSISL